MPHSNIPHPEMVAKSEEVRQAFTPEVLEYLLSLIPKPHFYGELHDRFEGSITGFYKGDPEKVKECEEARRALEQAMSIILGISKAVSVADPGVYEKFGGVHQRSSSAGAVVAAARDLQVRYDKQGLPYCSVTRLAGVKGYEIWFCVGDPGVESNWSMLTWSSTCKKMYLKGLNRTVTNYLKVRGIRVNQAGPWSNLVILPPV